MSDPTRQERRELRRNTEVCQELFQMPPGVPLPERIPDPCTGEPLERLPGVFIDPAVIRAASDNFSSAPCPEIRVNCPATVRTCASGTVPDELGQTVTVTVPAGSVFERIYCEDIDNLTATQRDYLIAQGAAYQALANRDLSGNLTHTLDDFITVTQLTEAQASGLRALIEAAYARVVSDASGLADFLLEGLCLYANAEQTATCPKCPEGDSEEEEAQREASREYAESAGLIPPHTYDGDDVLSYTVPAGLVEEETQELADQVALSIAQTNLGPCYLVNVETSVECPDNEGSEVGLEELVIPEALYVEVVDPFTGDPSAACTEKLTAIAGRITSAQDSFLNNECRPTGGVTITCSTLSAPVDENGDALPEWSFTEDDDRPNSRLQVDTAPIVIETPEELEGIEDASWSVTILPGVFFGETQEEARLIAANFAVGLLDCYYTNEEITACCPPLPALDGFGQRLWFFGDRNESETFSKVIPADLFRSDESQALADADAWLQGFIQLECQYCNLPIAGLCIDETCSEEDLNALQEAVGALGLSYKLVADALDALSILGVDAYDADASLDTVIHGVAGRALYAGTTSVAEIGENGGSVMLITYTDGSRDLVYLPEGLPPIGAATVAAGDPLFTYEGDPSDAVAAVIPSLAALLTSLCDTEFEPPACETNPEYEYDQDGKPVVSMSATPGLDYGMICQPTPDGLQATAESLANTPLKSQGADGDEECCEYGNPPMTLYCRPPEAVVEDAPEAADATEEQLASSAQSTAYLDSGSAEDQPDAAENWSKGQTGDSTYYYSNEGGDLRIYFVPEDEWPCLLENRSVNIPANAVTACTPEEAFELAVEYGRTQLGCTFGNRPMTLRCGCFGGLSESGGGGGADFDLPCGCFSVNAGGSSSSGIMEECNRDAPTDSLDTIFASGSTTSTTIPANSYTSSNSSEEACEQAKQQGQSMLTCIYTNNSKYEDECPEGTVLLKAGFVPSGMIRSSVGTPEADGFAQILAEELRVCLDETNAGGGDSVIAIIINIYCGDYPYDSGGSSGGGGGDPPTDSSDSNDGPGIYLGSGSISWAYCNGGTTTTLVWENGLITSNESGAFIFCDCDHCAPDQTTTEVWV